MNRQKLRFAAPVLAASLFLGVASPRASAETIVLAVEPGASWTRTTWFGVFPLRHVPQMACWIEDSNGEFVRTVSVTESVSKNSWKGAPAGGRPESLPVWTHASLGSPDAVDGVSSASRKSSFALSREAEGLVAGREYVAFLEVNSSFDYNDAWPKKARPGTSAYSGVNGQPSLVYEARFVAGVPGEAEFSPLGIGSVDGADGEIRPNFVGLTSALTIVKSAKIIVKE